MQSEIQLTPLFSALTRPTMYWGVSIEYFSFCLFGCTALFLVSKSFLALLVAYPMLHALGAMACYYDPHYFALLLKKALCPPIMNQKEWGLNAYEPF